MVQKLPKAMTVTNLKEKQSEMFLASLILKTLGCWEKFSIAFRTGLLINPLSAILLCPLQVKIFLALLHEGRLFTSSMFFLYWGMILTSFEEHFEEITPEKGLL